MAEDNRRSHQDWDRDIDRSYREGQRRRQGYGGYGGGYEQSSYGQRDSAWDRDEYRRSDLWDREHHLRADREGDRGDVSGNRYGSDDNRSRYHTGDRRWQENRHNDRTGSDRDRDWWDRSRDEVSSWFGDDEAERRRRMDEQRAGAIHRGKGPKGYRRSEERIREDAYERLTDDDRVDATNIQVQMEGDDVVLTGSVHSREERRRAEDLVERVSGVHNVQNRLRIDRDQSGNASMGREQGWI